MPEPSILFNQVAHSGQRVPRGRALSMMLAMDVLELVAPATGTDVELRAAFATTVAIQTWLASDLLTAGKTKLAAHGARKVTLATAGSTQADAPADCVINGTDINDNVISETLVLQQTSATSTSVKCYKTIVSIVFAAGDGTGATISMGMADTFGFPSEAKTRGSGMAVLAEREDGGVPTAGTFTVAATSAPFGCYAPNSSPNGALDFVVWYEQNVTTL